MIRRAFHTFHVSIHPIASKVQAFRHTVTTELRERSVALAEVAGLLNIGRGCALNRMLESGTVAPSNAAVVIQNPTDRAVAGAIDDFEFHDLLLQHPQGPANPSLGWLGTSQRNQFGFLLAVKNPSNRRRRALLAAQNSLKKLWDGGEGVASSLPTKLMEMPHDNPCKRYESIPRRL